MFCPKCGSQNVDTNKFCKKCGKNLPVRGQIQQAGPQSFTPQHSPGFLGQVLDGKYRIDAKLGSGGMGDVYRATRLLIGDVVAVKILHPHLARDPQAAERFRREAVMATKLRHRNVVGIYDVGISAAHGVPYILMELAEGFTLRQIINQYRVLPLDFAVTITTQVCSALDEAHGLGIVHRDIKPENIVANQTTTGWYIKVLDFGIAKLYNQGDIGLTQDGSAMGTPQYMSPEQCLGETLDARSDIYSVGIMLYEMLTGTVPFKSPTASAIAIHQVQTAPQPLRTINAEIHPAVEAVILKSLEKQREPRQQKASQLAQELISAATVAFKPGFTAVPDAPITALDIEPEFTAADDPSPDETVAMQGDAMVVSPHSGDAPTVELIGTSLADDPSHNKTVAIEAGEVFVPHPSGDAPTVELVGMSLADTEVIVESDTTETPPIEPPDEMLDAYPTASEAAASISVVKKPRRSTRKKASQHKPVEAVVHDRIETIEPVPQPDTTSSETTEAASGEATEGFQETDDGVQPPFVELGTNSETPERAAIERDYPPQVTPPTGDTPLAEVANAFQETEDRIQPPVGEFQTNPELPEPEATQGDDQPEIAAADDMSLAEAADSFRETDESVRPTVGEFQTNPESTEPADYQLPVAAPVEDMSLVFAEAELLLDDLLTERPRAEENPVASIMDGDRFNVPLDDAKSDYAPSSPEPESQPAAEQQKVEQDQIALPSFAAEPLGGSGRRKHLSSAAVIGGAFLLSIFLITIPVLYYFLSGSNSGQQTQNAPSNSAKATENSPPGMAFVPGGEFMMGSDTGHKDSRPAHNVGVKSFYMDITEVTNEEYKKFVDATKYSPPPDWKNGSFPDGKEKFPVTGVNWDDASAYAAWAEKRLPTEEEWEFAARGTDGRIYPWGNNWGSKLANAGNNAKGHHGMAEVGEHSGKSPFGMLDMAGNAWEWTSSDYVPYLGGSSPAETSGKKVIRGGCFDSDPNEATTTFRIGWLARGLIASKVTYAYENTGFRCAKDPLATSQ